MERLFAVSRTIQQLLYNCFTTKSSQPKTKYLAHSFQCLKLPPCKGIVENITAAPRRMSKRFVRKTPCSPYDKGSRIESSRIKPSEADAVYALWLLSWGGGEERSRWLNPLFTEDWDVSAATVRRRRVRVEMKSNGEGTREQSETVNTREAKPRTQPNGWPRRHTKLDETQQKPSEDRDTMYARVDRYEQGSPGSAHPEVSPRPASFPGVSEGTADTANTEATKLPSAHAQWKQVSTPAE